MLFPGIICNFLWLCQKYDLYVAVHNLNMKRDWNSWEQNLATYTNHLDWSELKEKDVWSIYTRLAHSPQSITSVGKKHIYPSIIIIYWVIKFITGGAITNKIIDKRSVDNKSHLTLFIYLYVYYMLFGSEKFGS